MRATYIFGLLFLLQVAGCTVTGTAPATGAMPGGSVVVERLLPDAAQDRTDVTELSQSAGSGGTVVVEQLPPLPEIVPEAAPVAVAPAASTAPISAALPTVPEPRTETPAAPATVASIPPTPSATTTPPVAATSGAAAAPSIGTAVADKPAAKVPAKVAAPVVRATPPQKPGAAPARAKAPSLDLAALEQRIKSTDAIGVFTKIALKNQVDDLLKQFKNHHEGNGKTALAQLRQAYDQLLLKVNDVLKNGDPSLATEIMGSREVIWGVLTDPEKFAKL